MKVGYKYHKYIAYKFSTFEWLGRIRKCISYNTLCLLVHYFSYISHNKLQKVIKVQTHSSNFKFIHAKPYSLDFPLIVGKYFSIVPYVCSEY